MMTSKSGNDQKLLEAARRCDGSSLERIITDGKVNFNVTDQLGCTAVHLCCKSADLKSLAMLLEHGARTDVFDHSGMAPFHHAADRDYIGTMAVLVSYGANINVKNKKTLKTPMHYATSARKSRATKFLLFCGADPDIEDIDHKAPITGLSREEAVKHNEIRNGYIAGRIISGGKMLKQNETITFKAIGLTLENTDKDSKTFSFFCRKISLEYFETEAVVSEVISDVFEYLVNQAADKITVTIPVYSKASTFDEVRVRDNTGQEYKSLKCVEDKRGIFYTFNMALKAFEDNIYSFFVTMVTKQDRYTATGGAQTVRSSVDEKFQVYLPECCLPINTKIEMKVLPVVDSYLTGLNTEYVRNVSNFCELRLANKNRKKFSVSLPLPQNLYGEDSKIRVFHANEETQTPTEWKEVDVDVRREVGAVTVSDASINKGTCVVTEVPKKEKDGFLKWVREFLSWLHNIVTNRLKPCCFFAMTKSCPDNIFRVLVGVTDEQLYGSVVRKWVDEKYVTQLAQKKTGYLLKPNSKILTKLGVDGTKFKGLNSFMMVYQAKKESFQEFLVIGKEHDTTNVFIFKWETDMSKSRKQEIDTSQCLTQINVELLMDVERIDSVELLQFKEFPDSKFLTWLAGEIGHEWMMIGIGLGLKYSYLETIEKGNNAHRANLTMLYTWRGENDTKQDLGLTALLHSLTKTGRKDIVTYINKDVQALMKTKPDERVSQWVKHLTIGLDDVDACPPRDSKDDGICISCLVDDEDAVSPFTEKFLLSIVSIIGSNLQLLQQLNMPISTVEGVRHSMHDPVSAMFKCLLLAQRNYGDVVNFFEDLFLEMQLQQNREAIVKIKQECRKWLKTQTTPGTSGRRLEQILGKY